MLSIYDIIRKPCLTEKGYTLQNENNQVVLKVHPQANKLQIKEAMEKLFSVKVSKVRTCNMHGKDKRMGRHIGRTQDWKKAVVSLAEGHKVDFLEDL